MVMLNSVKISIFAALQQSNSTVIDDTRCRVVSLPIARGHPHHKETQGRQLPLRLAHCLQRRQHVERDEGASRKQ
jgi:hypothetical protein